MAFSLLTTCAPRACTHMGMLVPPGTSEGGEAAPGPGCESKHTTPCPQLALCPRRDPAPGAETPWRLE